jgi:arylsulfatase A-like enzyme
MISLVFKRGKGHESLPKDFYATRNYTDILMNMIRENRGDGKPFFAYLAYTAQLKHPKKFRDREVEPMRGRSITGLLSGDKNEVYGADEAIGAEMGGGKWLRIGDYKAVEVPPPYGQGQWQLFDLKKDLGETEDLSKKHPEKMKELKAAWKQYADDVGVVETTGAMNR